MASLLRFACVMAAGRFHPRKSGSGWRLEAARFGNIRQDAAGRRQAFRERDAFVEQRLIEPFAPYLKEHSRYLETVTFFFQGHPNLELDAVFPATSFADWPTAKVRIAAIFERVLGAYPSLHADVTWHFFPDRRRMRAGEVEDVLRGGN